MKKFSYFYFGFMTLLWPGVDWLLSVLTPYHPAWLFLLPVYVSWYFLSAPLIYRSKLRQCKLFRESTGHSFDPGCLTGIGRKGFKEGFLPSYDMQAQWTTIWVDARHNELAYLCMFNPFRIQYLPLAAVNHAEAEVHDSKSKEYIHYVNLKFAVYGKQNKIRVDTGGRGCRFYAETNGKALVERTRQFAEVLNGGGNGENR